MLSMLHERLAEAHGLTMAGSKAAAQVEERTADDRLRAGVRRIRGEADDIRRRCLALERELGGVGEEILARANTVDERGADLAGAWFKAGTDTLTAWTFLAMGEAGELAAWSAVEQLAQGDLHRLAAWSRSLHEQHLRFALDAVAALAAAREPAAPRPG
ncbi:MAG TPA: hypothetical protein VH816_05765 [Gaiellaceae bacterium]|jgi:hypothetical protein